ncbi:protein FAM210B, mitochondrial isoform X1 [Mustelus asterias]
MLSPFLQQSRQSCVLLLLPPLQGCLGRGASRACRLATAVRTGARTDGGDRSFGEPARERWPVRRVGALRGLCTSASRDGKTEKEARRFDNSDGKKLSKSQQLKQVFKEYGAVGVVFHTGISLTSLGMFYLAVSRHYPTCSRKGCPEAWYVGETMQTLRRRMNEHCSTITMQECSFPVGEQFSSHGHSASDLRISVLQGGLHDTRQRRIAEQKLIAKFRTHEDGSTRILGSCHTICNSHDLPGLAKSL